ncbi:MAG: S41 family peptidase, partial [Planctomycetota bacterium]
MLSYRSLTAVAALLLAAGTAFTEEAQVETPPVPGTPSGPGGADSKQTDAASGRETDDTIALRLEATRLLSRLEGAESDEVWAIATELGNLGEGVAAVLLPELDGADEPKKVALGRALCLAGELERGRSVLLKLAHRGSTREVRFYAARAVGMSTEPTELDRLADALSLILDAEGDGLVRVALADAILRVSREWSVAPSLVRVGEGRVGLASERALAALKKALKAKNTEAAREAALVLGENGHDLLVRPRLREIAAEPTGQGRRARLVLYGVRPSWVRVLDEVARNIEKQYVDPAKVDRDALLAAAAKGMARSLDDFSDYLAEEDVKGMNEMLSNSYEGIGAVVGMRDGYFTIISPFYKGPAYRAGLRSMDRIVEVAGHAAGEMGFEKTIKKLKGPKGTPVRLKVARRGWSEAHEFTIVRDRINVKSYHACMLPGRVGYVRLVRFSEDSGRFVRGAVAELVKKGARGLLFDLRDNGGGLLSEAVQVADVFIEPGDGSKVIVYSKGRQGVAPVNNHFSTKSDELAGMPLVVLVNTGSASASEIVAGALQDWRRAR